MKKMYGCAILGILVLGLPFLVLGASAGDRKDAIIPQLTPTATFADVTVPMNGDVNPYGVSFVPEGYPSGGVLHPGDIIVSNFNDSANLQGTGTTIVRVNNNQAPTLFFQGQQGNNGTGLGLTTALGVLSGGFVLVGNVPSINTNTLGMCNNLSTDVGQGGLLVIDKNGNLVETLTSAALLDGPWDLTIKDEGRRAKVFVSNVLSGTVTRIDLKVEGGDANRKLAIESETQIASGYLHRCDPAAFVVGPTGVALDQKKDILYVSSTGDNEIFAIQDASGRTSDAGTGTVVVNDASHLHGPLGLVLADNGDLISTQGDAVNTDAAQPSEVAEFTPEGQFVAEISVDPGTGGAFGIALQERKGGFILATVDDNGAPPFLDIWIVK